MFDELVSVGIFSVVACIYWQPGVREFLKQQPGNLGEGKHKIQAIERFRNHKTQSAIQDADDRVHLRLIRQLGSRKWGDKLHISAK